MGLTFVTVMQNQWVRSRPTSPSSKEQMLQEWQSDEEERRGEEGSSAEYAEGEQREEGTDRLVCLAHSVRRGRLLLQ